MAAAAVPPYGGGANGGYIIMPPECCGPCGWCPKCCGAAVGDRFVFLDSRLLGGGGAAMVGCTGSSSAPGSSTGSSGRSSPSSTSTSPSSSPAIVGATSSCGTGRRGRWAAAAAESPSKGGLLLFSRLIFLLATGSSIDEESLNGSAVVDSSNGPELVPFERLPSSSAAPSH